MERARLTEKIREVLQGMNGVSVDANGFYYCECEMSLRDSLSDAQISDVLAGIFRCRVNGKEQIEKTEPRNALCNILAECYQDEMWRIEDEILDVLREDSDIAAMFSGAGSDEEQMTEQLITCLEDVWYVQPPVDEYLKQDVCMDIMLDTGDMNYGFACNYIDFSEIKSAEDFDDNSSLLWLCEQQGITREELLAAYDKGSAHSDELLELRARKAELVAELLQFGFVLPKFADRVVHTGAYQEYARLQAQLVRLTKEMQTLSEKRAQNNLSYQEYLKRHFDRFERLDPMSEEQFKEKKAEILERLDAKLETAAAEYSRVKDRLDFGTDYRRIAMLAEEHRSIQWKLSDLEKTEEYKKAEFVDSVINEVNNLSSSVGLVTFLVKMPLEEAIRIGEVIDGEMSLNSSYSYGDRTGRSSFVLGKDVRCGLLDITNGGGSYQFDIALYKDVEIPTKAIYRVVPDEELGSYGFMSTYGMNDEPYEEALKEIRVVVPEKVEDLIAAAVDKCERLNMDTTARSKVDADRGIFR